MPTREMSDVIQHLRRTILLCDGAGLTDAQLLEAFIRHREEAALAVLVRRHGPMVWGVCRRVLRDYHDAENAFQATFLVLVRKAASIVPRERVANWLYGVARQTALKARATAAKRRTRERQVTKMPEPAAAETGLWHDLQPLLDEELSRLPAKYRVVIVLCDLEGKTRKETARQLGVPEGTVAGQLARARTMLAKRLARRGLALSGGVLVAVLAQHVASASVPTSVLSSTIKAVTLYGSGHTAAAGLISATAAALTEGVVKTMLLSKLKIATSLFLAAGIVTAAVSLVMLPVLAIEPPQSPKTNTSATPEGAEPQAATKPVVIRADAWVTKLAWNADGKVVASVGGISGEPIVLTDHEGKNPKTIKGWITTVKLWDAGTGKLEQALSGEKNTTINDIAFSPDGKTAALSVFRSPEKKVLQYSWIQKGGDPPIDRGKQEIRIVDANTWALKQTIPVDQAGILQHFAFSPDGKTLAFGGSSVRVVGGAYVKLWDVQNEKMKGGTKFEAAGRFSRGDGDVQCLAFSPDGTLLAAGDQHGRVRLFDGQTGEVKQVWDTAHGGVVRGVAFSPDEWRLASVSEDKTVKLWDVPRRTLWWAPEGNKGVLVGVAFSPDGKLLATGGNVKEEDKYVAEVILWDATTWKPKQILTDEPVVVHALAFSPDGKTLAIGGARGRDIGKDDGKVTGEIKLVPVE